MQCNVWEEIYVNLENIYAKVNSDYWYLLNTTQWYSKYEYMALCFLIIVTLDTLYYSAFSFCLLWLLFHLLCFILGKLWVKKLPIMISKFQWNEDQSREIVFILHTLNYESFLLVVAQNPWQGLFQTLAKQ